MKRHYYLLLGIMLYILMLSLLLDFNWAKMLRPIPLMAVLLGMSILTLSQYKRGIKIDSFLYIARWNAFFSGLITSLLSLLTVITSERGLLNVMLMAEKLIPLIYGSIFYLILDLILMYIDNSKVHTTEIKEDVLLNLHRANEVLMNNGFSVRECHVASKLLEGATNKEIAKQLFISEATVKKHIQNMFKKCDATDRQNFIEIYMKWVSEGSPLN